VSSEEYVIALEALSRSILHAVVETMFTGGHFVALDEMEAILFRVDRDIHIIYLIKCNNVILITPQNHP